MLTLCCSENHQEICYEGIACPLCKAMEDLEDLKIESLKPCVTCDVFNENERLKESLLEIKANSYPGLAVKESTMLNTIFRLSTQALKGEPNGRYRIRPKDFS